jgi:hypothetical protein
MTTFLTGIPSNEIDEVWQACEPFIELAAKKGQAEMTSKDIYEFCKDARMQLWIVFDDNADIKAVVTTEIINYPRKKVCRVVISYRNMGRITRLSSNGNILQERIYKKIGETWI